VLTEVVAERRGEGTYLDLRRVDEHTSYLRQLYH
jgi:hypothetical protein